MAKQQKKATIHVIGCGGIGSYLIRELAHLRKHNQIVSELLYSIVIYDNDEVEDKNLKYQDYVSADVFSKKSEVLGKRHNLNYVVDLVKDLGDIVKPNDIVISCVDNSKFRKHLFEWQDKTDNFWIDLRSHGTTIARFCRSSQNTLEKLLETLPKEVENNSGSCQRLVDLEAGKIQMGNRIIAQIGCQTLLNYLRSDPQPDSYFIRAF